MNSALIILVWAIAIAVGGPIVIAAIAGILAFLYVIIDGLTANTKRK